jgi:large subunit ribosomal protein L28
MNVTERAITLTMNNNGFDHYVLKSPACDLRSELVCKLKAKMIKNILEGFPAWQDSPQKQKELENEFKNYAEGWTEEDCEWYGLNWLEAVKKHEIIQAESNVPAPLKDIFRSKLIEQLKQKALEIELGKSSSEKSVEK